MIGAFFGKRRRGKSTLMLHTARGLGLTVVIFDINRQFRQVPAATVSSADDLAALLDRAPMEVVFRPAGDVVEGFAEFAGVVSRFDGITVCIDESSRLQGASYVAPALDTYARFFGFEENHLLQALHRPQDLSTALRSLQTDFYYFRTRESRSLQAIADQCGSEVADLVSGLDGRAYLHWNDDEEKFEVVSDSAGWLVNLDVGGVA